MSSEDDFDAFYTATSRRLVSQLFAMLGYVAEAEDRYRRRSVGDDAGFAGGG